MRNYDRLGLHSIHQKVIKQKEMQNQNILHLKYFVILINENNDLKKISFCNN